MIHREESASLVQMLLCQNRIQVAERERTDNPILSNHVLYQSEKRTYLLVNNSLAAVNGPRFQNSYCPTECSQAASRASQLRGKGAHMQEISLLVRPKYDLGRTSRDPIRTYSLHLRVRER
jgi:hypothetical protein